MNAPIDILHIKNMLGAIWGSIIVTIFLLAALPVLAHASQTPSHTITFDNQSGRNAVVRVMGPTKAVAKMQRDETRIVRVVTGEYYILVRYGDSEKEYSYTKSSPFSVTQSDGKFSIITFILHRRGGGSFNVQPVSGTEFETGIYSRNKSLSP